MGDQQPWEAKTFRDQFIADFAAFLGDQNHTPQNTHTHVSPDDMRFFSDLSRFMKSYANLYRDLTTNRHKPQHPQFQSHSDNYLMKRYINQKDDPFTGMEKSQAPTLTTPVGNPRNMIEQAHKGLRERLPEEYTDVSLTATTQERSSNKVFKTIASHTAAAGIRVESTVGDLHQGGPSSQGDTSRAGSSGGIHHRDDGGSRARGPRGRRPRPDELFTVNQGLSENLPRRASAGSKVSSSSRREPKVHLCPDCQESFRFDARLKSHMAVHRKEKILCPACGSGFGRESSLKRHQNTPSCQRKKQAKLLDSSHSGPIAGSSHTCESTASGHDRESDVSTEGIRLHGMQYHVLGGDLIPRDHAPENPIDRHLQNVNYPHRQYDEVLGYYTPQGPGQSHPTRNTHRGAGSPAALMWDTDAWLVDDYQRDTRGGDLVGFLDPRNEDD